MDVIIFGVGNYTEVVIELCLDCGHNIIELYHFDNNRTGENILGFSIAGDYNLFYKRYSYANVVVAIGNNNQRYTICKKLDSLGFNLPSLIHPKSYISSSAILGKGVFVHLNSIIWTKSIIGDFSILSPSSFISHHVIIGWACLISANSSVGSYVVLKNRVLLGINSGILSKNITIGDDVIVGANAMVINSIKNNLTVKGTPAK